MPVTVACPQLGDAALRTQLYDAVSTAVRRWRPSFELWKLSLLR